MDKSTLRELLQRFDAGELEELEVQWSFWHGTRIHLCRRRALASQSAVPEAAPRSGSQPAGEPAVPPAPSGAPPARDGSHAVLAPMVGTFYRAPSPDAEPFVREGDRVHPGQTLCLIEAMKIMNEIEADVEGEVIAILVGNAEPVEYNQPLIKIRPT